MRFHTMCLSSWMLPEKKSYREWHHFKFMVSNLKRILNTTQKSYSFIWSKAEFATAMVTCKKCSFLSLLWMKFNPFWAPFCQEDKKFNFGHNEPPLLPRIIGNFWGFMRSRTLLSFLVWPFFSFKFTLVTHCWCLHGPDPHDPFESEWLWYFPSLPSPASPYTSLLLCSLWLLWYPWHLYAFCSLCLECTTPILFTWSTSHPSDVSFKSSLPTWKKKIKTIIRYHFTNILKFNNFLKLTVTNVGGDIKQLELPYIYCLFIQK